MVGADARRRAGPGPVRHRRPAGLEPRHPDGGAASDPVRAQPRHRPPRPQARQRHDRRLRRGLRPRLGHRGQPARRRQRPAAAGLRGPRDGGHAALHGAGDARRRRRRADHRAHRRLPRRRHALRDRGRPPAARGRHRASRSSPAWSSPTRRSPTTRPPSWRASAGPRWTPTPTPASRTPSSCAWPCAATCSGAARRAWPRPPSGGWARWSPPRRRRPPTPIAPAAGASSTTCSARSGSASTRPSPGGATTRPPSTACAARLRSWSTSS